VSRADSLPGFSIADGIGRIEPNQSSRHFQTPYALAGAQALLESVHALIAPRFASLAGKPVSHMPRTR
jgi:hypothetical protein